MTIHMNKKFRKEIIFYYLIFIYYSDVIKTYLFECFNSPCDKYMNNYLKSYN